MDIVSWQNILQDILNSLEQFRWGRLEWQATIIFSLWLCWYRYPEKKIGSVDLLFATCIFWSLWTIIEVYSTQLEIKQLFVIWFFRHMLLLIGKKNKKILDLELEIESATGRCTEEEQEKIRQHDSGVKEVLRDKEHRNFLIKSIKDAKERIIIMSAWVSASAIQAHVGFELEKALEKGRKIYIGFGYETNGEYEARDEESEERLLELSDKYFDQLYIGKFATHQKLLVIDSETIVWGSANWLSNRKFKNTEASVVISDTATATSEGVVAEELICKHRIALPSKVEK